ncbi:MAG: LysR substrate-binding domain-containing protein [Pseudorhodoplanes sp.]
MRPLSLRQIEAFRALVEGGTVTRAAELLHVSQPAISKQLANLEADCGVALFDRTKGRLVLTNAGVRLYDEVSKIFIGVNQLQDAVDAIRREQQGRLVVGISPALSYLFGSRIVQTMIADNPGTFVTFVTLPSQGIAEKLKQRQMDVGLLFPNFHVSNAYLQNEEFLSEPIVCLLPSDHKLAKRPHISPGDIADLPIITSPPGSQMRRLLEDAFRDHGTGLKSMIETSTMTSIPDFVRAGLGVSLVHPLFADDRSGDIAIRPFVPETRHHMLISYSPDTRNANLIKSFSEITKTIIAETYQALQKKHQRR